MQRNSRAQSIQRSGSSSSSFTTTIMKEITSVIRALLTGIMNSITGIAVVFYLDREVDKKRQAVHDHQQLVALDNAQLGALSGRLSRWNASASQASGGRNSVVGRGAPPAINKPEKSNVLRHVLNCCMMNGGVCWLSIILFERVCLPVFHQMLFLIVGLDSEVPVFIWGWMQPVLSLLFSMVWVLPLFLITRLVNALWFQDIANSAYQFRKGRIQSIGFSVMLADLLFSFVVAVAFLMQSQLMNLIPCVPYVGRALSFVHMSFLNSLYAFEYKWLNMGWELHKRLQYIEQNWAYFLGFGMPLAFLTMMADSVIVNGCIFASLFPFFILSANEATPLINMCSFPVKLFSPSVALANALLSTTINRTTQPPPPTAPPAVGAPPPPHHPPNAPPPTARPSISHASGSHHSSAAGGTRQHAQSSRAQTVHGVDMSAFLADAASAASLARRHVSVSPQSGSGAGLSQLGRGSPAPSSTASSHRGSPHSMAGGATTAQQQRVLRPRR